MIAWLRRLLATSAIGPAWVEAGELRRRLDGGAPPLVVDVRGPDEFDGPLGHIEGSVNVPLASVPARLGELSGSGRPIVLVCLTDKRSSQAAADLAAAGIGDIAVLRGGMKAWRETS